jgi:hypothetical protein
MNEEYNKAEEQKYAGLTTAALAEAGQETAPQKPFELRPSETDLRRTVRAGGVPGFRR